MTLRGRIASLCPAVLLAAAVTGGVAWLSRVPSDFAAGDRERATVRLSWRVDGVRAEACRTRSEEELAELPPHMRSPRTCARTLVPFELSARLGTDLVLRDTVFPGGIRGDRPIYVFRELSAAPGRSTLSVRFDAVLPVGVESRGDRVTSYAWDGEIELGPGEVALLTLVDGGAFALRTPPS